MDHFVVSYRNSTSNHNQVRSTLEHSPLYLIEILHQTTTLSEASEFLLCCILSKFYIKPQHFYASCCAFVVVSYRNSTSNHNHPEMGNEPRLVVSYRNSTSNHNIKLRINKFLTVVSYRNSTSNHNWLDSGCLSHVLYLIEILHQTTTTPTSSSSPEWLYLIEILHQTTTFPYLGQQGGALYLIEILHQTTT